MTAPTTPAGPAAGVTGRLGWGLPILPGLEVNAPEAARLFQRVYDHALDHHLPEQALRDLDALGAALDELAYDDTGF